MQNDFRVALNFWSENGERLSTKMTNSPEIHVVPRKNAAAFFSDLSWFILLFPSNTLSVKYTVCACSCSRHCSSVTTNYCSRGSFLIPLMLFLSPMLGKESFKNGLIVFLAAANQHTSKLASTFFATLQ